MVPAHPLFRPVADEVVWNGRFPLQRVRFRYLRRDGTPSDELTWEMWRRGRAVLILPWDPDTDRVALIEQFRLPALAAGYEPMCLECPAGLLEPGEEYGPAAARELGEETGLDADRIEELGRYMLQQGGCDEVVSMHLARVRLPEAGELGLRGLADEAEEIRVFVLPFDEALDLVLSGRINNAPAMIALLWMQARREALLRDWKRA